MRKKDLYRAIAKLAIENEQLDDYENSLMAGNDKLIAEIDSLRKIILDLTAENERLKHANWDTQAELDNRPIVSVYPDDITISKPASGYLEIEEMKSYIGGNAPDLLVYPDPSLRSVDSEDDLPEM